jgi:hypothetical protein
MTRIEKEKDKVAGYKGDLRSRAWPRTRELGKGMKGRRNPVGRGRER